MGTWGWTSRISGSRRSFQRSTNAAAGETAYVEIEITGTIGRRMVKLRSCDRLTVRGGRIVERVAYADPGPLLAAVALTPRVWPTFIRMQINQRRR